MSDFTPRLKKYLKDAGGFLNGKAKETMKSGAAQQPVLDL
jgi:hypothetical protein